MKNWVWLRWLFRRSGPSPAGVSSPQAFPRAENLSVLALAYLGDAVHELYVRQNLVQDGATNVNRMHATATRHVRARAQAAAMRSLWDSLSGGEREVARRGRNARTGHVPKGAEPAEYHLATAFEALVGYLYLSGAGERLTQVLEVAWKVTTEVRED